MENTKTSKVIVLVGIPASGKSTLVKNSYPDYQRISQDVLGNRMECENLAEVYLAAGTDIIIDRCNHTKKQRKNWIKRAKKYNAEKITCIYLKTDVQLCIERIKNRKGHESIPDLMPEEDKVKIINRFFKEFQEPSLEEGFTEVIVNETNGN